VVVPSESPLLKPRSTLLVLVLVLVLVAARCPQQ